MVHLDARPGCSYDSDPLTRLSSLRSLQEAANDASPVSGYTHDFYKYPARFSPQFVRTAIELFSEPGDLVLDPFVGGGTTLVEAMALGRHGLGADISSLAQFVTDVKTTLYRDDELELIRSWLTDVQRHVHMHRYTVHCESYAEAGYYRNLTLAKTWRLRKATEQALASALRVLDPRLQTFARCVILRTAQWALDGRKRIPTVREFREALLRYGTSMIAGAQSFREAVEQSSNLGVPTAICFNKSASELAEDPLIRCRATPSLVLTSPPYPGIHVLYHRWQVDGRKETPAPFWIANKLDGAGASHYTLGDRHSANLDTYFDLLRGAMLSTAALCDEATTIIQVVAFSEPETQLERYVRANRDAGLLEVPAAFPSDACDGRLWRKVPNRKWHARQQGETSSSREVVLFFRRTN